MKKLKLKAKTRFRILSVSILVVLICACESHEGAADTDFNRVKEQGQFPIDTPITPIDLQPKVNPKLKQSKKVVAIDSWTLFTNKTTGQTMANDSAILEIKTTSTNTKSIKKALALEKANIDLKTQIAQFKQLEKERLEKFQAQMLLELSALRLDLATLKEANAK